jgi:hypothetical protein
VSRVCGTAASRASQLQSPVVSQTAPRLLFTSDPGEFLVLAAAHLMAEPVVSTVVTTIAERFRSYLADGIPLPDRTWWLVVTDEADRVVGAGMRTAPFAPYPLFLLPMPDEAAIGVAQALHGRGEDTVAVNGALPAARLCAEELARLGGGRVQVAQHTRLHELGRLVVPPPVAGRLVAATVDDVDLAMTWFDAFMADADEQAGRPRGASAHESPDRDEMIRRISAGSVWFWVDERGRRVHLTAANPPAYGVARIGPVYTPPSERGRGWASNAVAEVSRRLQSEGVRVCLFTDQANPTSNKIYAALGYRPVVDMANLVITR